MSSKLLCGGSGTKCKRASKSVFISGIGEDILTCVGTIVLLLFAEDVISVESYEEQEMEGVRKLSVGGGRKSSARKEQAR